MRLKMVGLACPVLFMLVRLACIILLFKMHVHQLEFFRDRNTTSRLPSCSPPVAVYPLRVFLHACPCFVNHLFIKSTIIVSWSHCCPCLSVCMYPVNVCHPRVPPPSTGCLAEGWEIIPSSPGPAGSSVTRQTGVADVQHAHNDESRAQGLSRVRRYETHVYICVGVREREIERERDNRKIAFYCISCV